jgi:hypothetical protein
MKATLPHATPVEWWTPDARPVRHPACPESSVALVESFRAAAAGTACVALLILAGPVGAALVTFEDLRLPAESYWNGADRAGGFHSGGAFFKNTYDRNEEAEWWDGFAYSNLTDIHLEGAAGQYSAIAGGGQDGSATYGVAYIGWLEPPTITLHTPQTLPGLYVTNNNYVYYDMLRGGLFSKQFGGPTGTDPDWLKLSITGQDATGSPTGTVDFYLADFRFADSSQDYIVDSWQFVDLTSLGEVKTLQFALTSSDMHPAYGMNTPAYFCLDTIVPEPATVVLLALGALFAVRRRR